MTTLFESNGKTTPVIDPNETYYDKLVGEGKKFKDNEALAKAKAEADAFILRLQNEAEELRKDLNTRLTVEQIIEKTANGQNNLEPNQQGLNNQTPPKTEEKQNTVDIEKLVNDKLAEAELKRVQNSNLTLVRETLENEWGNDYVTRLKEKASELGLGESFLQNLAMDQPKAFLKLIDVGIDSKKPANNQSANRLFVPPSSNERTNTNSFSPSNTDRTKSYYDKLKATNPSEYWSPSTQNQMHQDAIRIGERFFDT